jgi:hypothetical protein
MTKKTSHVSTALSCLSHMRHLQRTATARLCIKAKSWGYYAQYSISLAACMKAVLLRGT